MMRKNSGQTALYELMGKRSVGVPSARPAVESTSSSVGVDLGGSWLSPGRMLHLPVGYLLLGAALAIGATIGAYVLGYRQASVVVRKEYEQNVLMNAAGIDSLTANDPLMSTPDMESSGFQILVPTGSTNDIPSVTMGSPSPLEGSSSMGPIFSDPRQVGLNYFILMQTTSEGAERVAVFCRTNGLETYVVGRNNARTFKVIVLPGYASNEVNSEKVRNLEALIHRVGEKWKQEEGGTTDFRDKYPSLYTG